MDHDIWFHDRACYAMSAVVENQETIYAAGLIDAHYSTYGLALIQTEDSISRILARGTVLQYPTAYFAMCFLPAPSQPGTENDDQLA